MELRTGHFPVELPDATQRQGNHRRTDTEQYDGIEVIANDGNIAEEIAARHQAHYPQQGAGDVVQLEFGERHFRYAGDKWREGAHDRDEARQYDGLAAVVFVKGMG